MSETLNSQLSAFVDGELSDREADLFLRQLERNPDLRDEAARYMLIGHSVRGEVDVPGMRDLAGRISAAIDVEELPASGAVAGWSTRWLRPAGGVAVAAAVAVLALVGLQNVEVGGSGQPSPSVAELAAVAIDEAPIYTEPPVADVTSDRPSEMLSRYYRHHGERSADLGASNILTRLVTLELREGELVRIEPPATGESDDPSLEKASTDLPSSPQ